MNRHLINIVDTLVERSSLGLEHAVGPAAYALRAEGLSWRGVAENLYRDHGTPMIKREDRARKSAKSFAATYGMPWPIPKS